MPNQSPVDPIIASWTAANDAARDALRGVGGSTPLAQRAAIRQRIEGAAWAVFEKAGAPIKSLRANITWGEGNPTVELEVISMDRKRYSGPTLDLTQHAGDWVQEGDKGHRQLARGGASFVTPDGDGVAWAVMAKDGPVAEGIEVDAIAARAAADAQAAKRGLLEPYDSRATMVRGA